MERHLKKYSYSSQRTADAQAGILVNKYVTDINGNLDYNSQTLTEDPNFKSYFWVDRIDNQDFNLTYNYSPDTYGVLYYSTDTGDSKTWTEYTEPIAITGKTYFKRVTSYVATTKIFTTDVVYKIGGNIFSIVLGDDYLNENYVFIKGVSTDFCNSLFKADDKLYDAENVVYNFIYKVDENGGFLPANNIFSGCTSLILAPAIFVPPYEFSGLYNVYRGCTSLTNGGEIVLRNPAMLSKLYGIYRQSSVTTIKCLVLGDNLSAGNNWVTSVPSGGTFIKNKNSTWTTGTSGIPEGWTVIDA